MNNQEELGGEIKGFNMYLSDKTYFHNEMVLVFPVIIYYY